MPGPIAAAGELIVRTVQAADQFLDWNEAQARQKTAQAARSEAQKTERSAQERAAQGASQTANKTRQSAEAAFTISIQGREAAPKPSFNGMSMPLQSYLKTQSMK